VLSGGPASVYDPQSPKADPEILRLGVPVLGICYGMQWIVHTMGGEVQRAEIHEYGRASLELTNPSTLFTQLPQRFQVWMSHGDVVKRIPPGFEAIGKTPNSPFAAIADQERKIFCVQFHPEVSHTEKGTQIIQNFLFLVCFCKHLWTMSSFIQRTIEEIREKVGNERVICALSGGVDSSTCAVLVHKAIGERLFCIFVNNGLLRKGEPQRVLNIFKEGFHINLNYVDGEKRFLERLKGVEDPEEKRRRIGEEFAKIFHEEAKKIGNCRYLAQGTLYPDVIESISHRGPSSTIKTHHNVGGMPKDMNLALIEPFRELFKDEVRKIAKELGLPDEIVWQHPFPGPGLAVRIIGEVTREKCELLREVDVIIEEELKKERLYRSLWQAFGLLLPIRTVGVMGDRRTYENVVAIRAVRSEDAMTAEWADLPHEVLSRISNRIVNEVRGVNRVVLDITSKPPATIEWE
jgi:GMP synthase (glutamine-hydrolysing)